MDKTEHLQWKVDHLELYMFNARVILEDFKMSPEQKIKLALIWLQPLVEEDK